MAKQKTLTQTDIEFLIQLQKEMNAEPTMTDSVVWTIRDYKKIYGNNLDDPDGIRIYDTDTCEAIYEGSWSESDNECKNAIKKALKDNVCFEEDMIQVIDKAVCIHDIADYVNDLGYVLTEYEEYPVDTGAFLTRKSAVDYLKSNRQHYSKKACIHVHTIMHTKEKLLWDILKSVDWSTV